MVQGFLAGLTLGLLPLPMPAELEDVPMPSLPALVDLHGTPFEAPADFLQVGPHNPSPRGSCLTHCCERAACAAHHVSCMGQQGLQWVVTVLENACTEQNLPSVAVPCTVAR